MLEKFKPMCWHLPRPSKSKYKGSYPLHFESKFKKLLESSDYAHFFCGLTQTGYPRIDLLIENKPDVAADCHYLPFRDNVFTNSLADPPYDNDYAKRLYNTPKLRLKEYLDEIVRVTKTNGVIALYHIMLIPRPNKTKYLGVITIITRVFHKARIVTVFKKEDKND